MTAGLAFAAVWLAAAVWTWCELVADMAAKEPPVTFADRLIALLLATLAPVLSVWVVRSGELS